MFEEIQAEIQKYLKHSCLRTGRCVELWKNAGVTAYLLKEPDYYWFKETVETINYYQAITFLSQIPQSFCDQYFIVT